MKIFSDSLHKIAYATDASAYREIPKGVAYPEAVQDIQELIALAARKGLDLEEPGFSDYQKFREEQLDLLADTIRKSLDMKLVYECLGMETI